MVEISVKFSDLCFAGLSLLTSVGYLHRLRQWTHLIEMDILSLVWYPTPLSALLACSPLGDLMGVSSRAHIYFALFEGMAILSL
jgi:hypothetical protein